MTSIVDSLLQQDILVILNASLVIRTLRFYNLCLHLKCTWICPHVKFQWPRILQELHIRPIRSHTALLPLLNILLTTQRRKAPVLRDDDFLSARKLILRAAERLDGSGAVGITCSYGKNDLTDVDTSDSAVRLAECATHTGLKTIGTGA